MIRFSADVNVKRNTQKAFSFYFLLVSQRREHRKVPGMRCVHRNINTYLLHVVRTEIVRTSLGLDDTSIFYTGMYYTCVLFFCGG